MILLTGGTWKSPSLRDKVERGCQGLGARAGDSVFNKASILQGGSVLWQDDGDSGMITAPSATELNLKTSKKVNFMLCTFYHNFKQSFACLLRNHSRDVCTASECVCSPQRWELQVTVHLSLVT
jgi:hypothetical protein